MEVMGNDCGYLALMSGLATGAERVYLPEEGITLRDLERDVTDLRTAFEHGKRLGLIIRGEHADAVYTTSFIEALFEKEGGGAFDVRTAILGHVQQGGDPTPFDRIQGTRLAARCIEYMLDEAGATARGSAMIGLQRGKVQFTPLIELPSLMEEEAQRPIEQKWMDLRPVAAVMAGRRAEE
jgi:6-phosphofructokinase 1